MGGSCLAFVNTQNRYLASRTTETAIEGLSPAGRLQQNPFVTRNKPNPGYKNEIKILQLNINPMHPFRGHGLTGRRSNLIYSLSKANRTIIALISRTPYVWS